MRKHKQPRPTAPAAPSPPPPAGKFEAFTFGEPVPVLDRRELLDLLECPTMGNKWYEPPISLDGLARTYRAAVYHSSAMQVKRNILVSCYQPHPLLTRSDFTRFVLDYLAFGNAYLECKRAVTGKLLALEPTLAKYTRRGVDLDTYWFVGGAKEAHKFETGEVFHLYEPDINQEIYGLPDYLSANHSTWLNESATLFRRKYYLNGSHAGLILYLTDPAHSQQDVEALREAMKNSKGPGNFRNLFMYAPGGKKDGMQVIPLSEVAAKDEFLGIKNVTRDDMLAAHRVPPQMMGIIPSNTGGFGDASKAAEVFVRNELIPLQNRMKELNEWLGQEVIRFDPYVLTKEKQDR
ncbi:phage portal protein [Chitinimonas sp. BJB300]|uniref:phage portal protein n=1 Tax=Chitinimonas sp. BJB300 TaxID=1559339 RepID=UPI000C10A867|nr:phage portal protein [Chitinimonas sp. BJB300]PHV11328.1 phage portal protein [Chitinimonas sp. BJB300]TSJ88223.1 phage portal protein [Chitinimonas sp. BJB300]